MPAISSILVSAWKSVLNQCRLQPDESAVILVNAASNANHIEAAEVALGASGVTYSVVRMGGASRARVGGESATAYEPSLLSSHPQVQAFLSQVDFIIDLVGLYRGTEQDVILDSGARILLVKEDPEIFIRLQPRPEHKQAVVNALSTLKEAKLMHVTSDAGTNFTAEFGQYNYLDQYGVADEPGRWDHCPSAFVAAWPTEKTATGIVILQPGDVILPFNDYVQSDIRLTIESGFITNIDGGFDAIHLKEYMSSFNEPDAYAVSHLGWGVMPEATWTSLRVYDKRQIRGMEQRSFAGCFMFSTGPNIEGGGTRNGRCHLDIPMIHCTVEIDGEPVVKNGSLV